MDSDTRDWGPIDPKRWREIPCITIRLANEQDVKGGRAVFFLANASEIGAHPADIDLPRCAILKEDDGSSVPVVVIQSEMAEDKHYLGYRRIRGGNGICFLHEVELLEAPNECFQNSA